jgi:opacity protein-like surface antigen
MLSVRKVIATGAVVLLASFGAAQAADMYTPMPGGMKGGGAAPVPAFRPTIQSHTQSGWYGRLDFGYAMYDDPVMVENGITTLSNTSIGSGWAYGFGIGRYFTSNVRGDLTFETRSKTDVEGTSGFAPFEHVPRRFDMSSQVFLANLYYDFNNNSRFTPYLGVGLGVVRHKTHDAVISDGCGCTGTIEGAKKWSVAGAFMAGVSVDLLGSRGQPTNYGSFKDTVYIEPSKSRLKLDIGYRFLYLGDATTGPITVDNGNVADDPTVEDIHAHEIRVGLRYDFN